MGLGRAEKYIIIYPCRTQSIITCSKIDTVGSYLLSRQLKTL